MPTFADTDLAGVTTGLASMMTAYWVPLFGIFGTLLVIALAPRIVKKFARL